jgi:hypothetical protein
MAYAPFSKKSQFYQRAATVRETASKTVSRTRPAVAIFATVIPYFVVEESLRRLAPSAT